MFLTYAPGVVYQLLEHLLEYLVAVNVPHVSSPPAERSHAAALRLRFAVPAIADPCMLFDHHLLPKAEGRDTPKDNPARLPI
jgi:hypothetical protein